MYRKNRYNGYILVVPLIFLCISLMCKILAGHVHGVLGRYNTGQTPYRAVSYRKRFRYDTRIVQLWISASMIGNTT